MAASMTEWSEAEEFYLLELCKLSQYLAQRYNICYLDYKKKQTRTRIPQIVVSSISGLFSFGTSVFPENYHSAINVSVGISSMLVALVGSIESFLKIPEIIAGSITASINFTKLAETISVELALPRHKRTSSGIVFLREAYKTYEKHSEAAPSVFRHVRFIRPFTDNSKEPDTNSKKADSKEKYRLTTESDGTPSTMGLYRSATALSGADGISYVPTDGYALRAPRPPNAIDLPV